MSNKPSATVTRQGVTQSGSSYSIEISIAGLEVNGVEIPPELAANAIADWTVKQAVDDSPDDEPSLWDELEKLGPG